jgi:squalene-hopene/tetraprenyl-beta-curcumene cyclase
LSLFADRAEVVSAYHRGLDWLVAAVESDRFLQSSPIGLYFAKLWYYEELYPIIFTASALRRAIVKKRGAYAPR